MLPRTSSSWRRSSRSRRGGGGPQPRPPGHRGLPEPAPHFSPTWTLVGSASQQRLNPRVSGVTKGHDLGPGLEREHRDEVT